MNEIQIILQTPIPELANDFCDVLKLFYQVTEFGMSENEPALNAKLLRHKYLEADGVAESRFFFRNNENAYRSEICAREDNELEYKRVRKRICKLSLYYLLKKITGKQPPWGSLTGIRPTRLFYEQLKSGKTCDEAKRHMVHTYDIRSEKAELLSRIVAQQQALPQPDENAADVYLSIPFCRTRCAYCSFPGECIGKGKLVAPYLKALTEEMKATAELLAERKLRLRALYIGGGTPSALTESDFELLIQNTMHYFPNALEYTVEAGRPDTITERKLCVLKEHGIERISVNPQTMNDETLRRIGRDHTSAHTVQAYEMARKMGFSNINMDVIAGLPGETARDFEHTMDEMLRLRPDSLTVHTLAIKHSSRLNLEKWPLPDGEEAAEMVRMGEKTAEALGLEPYYLYRQKYMAGQQQNVGYAIPGKACLYNVDIMEETMSVLALGAGAISKRVFPDHELRIIRQPNAKNVGQFIERIQEFIEDKRKLFSDKT